MNPSEEERSNWNERIQIDSDQIREFKVQIINQFRPSKPEWHDRGERDSLEQAWRGRTGRDRNRRRYQPDCRRSEKETAKGSTD